MFIFCNLNLNSLLSTRCLYEEVSVKVQQIVLNKVLNKEESLYYSTSELYAVNGNKIKKKILSAQCSIFKLL
jgi:hypothetical protein